MLADCSHMAGHYFHETWKLQICAADFKNIVYSFRCFCVSHGIPRSKIVIWFGSMDYGNLLLWLLFQNNVIYYDLFYPHYPIHTCIKWEFVRSRYPWMQFPSWSFSLSCKRWLYGNIWFIHLSMQGRLHW